MGGGGKEGFPYPVEVPTLLSDKVKREKIAYHIYNETLKNAVVAERKCTINQMERSKNLKRQGFLQPARCSYDPHDSGNAVVSGRILVTSRFLLVQVVVTGNSQKRHAIRCILGMIPLHCLSIEMQQARKETGCVQTISQLP